MKIANCHTKFEDIYHNIIISNQFFLIFLFFCCEIKQILFNINYRAIVAHCDSQRIIHLIKIKWFLERTKNIDIEYYLCSKHRYK